MKLVLSLALCMVGSLVADEFPAEGTWNAVTTLPDGEDRPATVVLTKKDSKYEGVVSTSDGEKTLQDVAVSKESVSFAIDIDYQGTPLKFSVSAKPEGDDALKGSWTAKGEDGSELATGDWKADREAPEVHPLVGDWVATSDGPDGSELAFDMEIKEEEGKFSGSMKSDDGTLPMKSVSFADSEVKIEVPFPYDGQMYPVTLTAKLDDDKMSGDWVAYNADGNEEESGEWKAVRPDAPTIEGTWEISATTPDDADYASVYHFEPGDDSGWKGKAVSDAGELAFDKVASEDGELVIDMELPYEGEQVEVRVKAKMSKDGKTLEGEWIAFDTSGQEAAKGSMKGTRKTES